MGSPGGALSDKERPPFRTGPFSHRPISTSTPGRSGPARRLRASMMTSSRSRLSRPTVTSGSFTQSLAQSGPTQLLSHTSTALAGKARTAVCARATANVREERLPRSDRGPRVIFPRTGATTDAKPPRNLGDSPMCRQRGADLPEATAAHQIANAYLIPSSPSFPHALARLRAVLSQ
jgi:hypothetical protein